MLTGDLIRARVKGSDVVPSTIDTGKPALQETAQALVATYEQAVQEGWRRSRLDDAIAELVGNRRDHKVVKGLNKILEKVGEEATETILAAKDAQASGDNRDVIYETADMWFHSLVMLSHLGESPQAVLDELARRFGMSGLEEKASRSSNG